MGLTSRTNTRRNIAILAEAGWGWIVGPLDRGGPILGGMPWALDNGAWPAHQQGVRWDEPAFLRACESYGKGALFVVAPDIVAGGMASLALTRSWLPRLLERPDLAGVPVLIAVQDGMEPKDVMPLLGGRVGVFVGGTTAWKLATLMTWGEVARQAGVYLHVGRVNTAKRIRLCAAAGANTFDGSGAAKFSKTVPMLSEAARQSDLFNPRRLAA